MKTNLAAEQQSEWALFLPAISSFYINGVGREMSGEQYFDQGRITPAIGDINRMNFLDKQKGLFYYEWGLYSAGHANLDINKSDAGEDIVRKRDPSIFMLGDSGGFQILTGQWPADWKDPNCPKAAVKRKQVLAWLEKYMNYGMCLDIPTRTASRTDIYDRHKIASVADAVKATHINNEYFIQNRTGETKFLNALHGTNHQSSDEWYDEMKKYCDPKQYTNHFNGWAMSGQNKVDIHLSLRRLVHLIHDGLLNPGQHDLVHYLGTSMLEWACMLTSIQQAIRKYHNPNLKITFDCASPFFGAAKGLIYNKNNFGQGKKWSYAMEKTIEDKSKSNDTRKLSTACLADGIHREFTDSPISDLLTVRDICWRGQGFIGQHGKETKTSWDSFSYTLLQAHNTYAHISAVQEANQRYARAELPKMLYSDKFDLVTFHDVVDRIFSLNDRDRSLAMIDEYEWFWNQFRAGSIGTSGRKTRNAGTMFDKLFTFEQTEPDVKSDEELEVEER